MATPGVESAVYDCLVFYRDKAMLQSVRVLSVQLSHIHCCKLMHFRPVISIRYTHTRAHALAFNGPLSGTTWVCRNQKGKTNLDFTEARDSEWQWHQLGHMQVCTSLQTDNHTSTPPLSFLQAGCPSCRPTNSVRALKASDLCKTPVEKPCADTG